ncbi:MAG: hypothetical protein HXY18_08880 [Bryobacteraceae bacterium]|nr:hypothetical protein [Bryobacteraceae bacterium]
MPVQSGLARFKVVIAATRDRVRLYPSIESLPAKQKRQAKEALEGELAATLLIADKKGLERMKRLLGRAAEKQGMRSLPLGVARQLGLGFMAAGAVLTALLVWAWLR